MSDERGKIKHAKSYVFLDSVFQLSQKSKSFQRVVFTGDIESLRRDLVDPARPMKSSAFASEEPAPFTPVSLKGSLFLVLLIMLPRDVYLRLLVTRERNMAPIRTVL